MNIDNRENRPSFFLLKLGAEVSGVSAFLYGFNHRSTMVDDDFLKESAGRPFTKRIEAGLKCSLMETIGPIANRELRGDDFSNLGPNTKYLLEMGSIVIPTILIFALTLSTRDSSLAILAGLGTKFAYNTAAHLALDTHLI